MKYYKISKLLNNSTVLMFVRHKGSRDQFIVNDLSRDQCCLNKNIRFKTSVLRSDPCHYSNVSYIIVKGTITPEQDNHSKTSNKKQAFKSNAPYQKSTDL